MTTVHADVLDLLHDDIAGTPEALRRFLERQSDHVLATAEACFRRDIGWILVAGRGSSDNVGRYGSYLFGAQCGLPVMTASPSLFTRYGNPPRLDGALVVAISASGRSRDVVSVVEEGRRQGRPTVAITNDPDSPIAEAAEFVVPLEAGDERGPTATRTYVASLAACALLAACAHRADDLLGEVERLPDAIASTLVDVDGIPGAAGVIAGASRVSVVGRGYNLATSNELALKLSAVTRTAALSYSAADLLRGPSARQHPSPVILVATSGRVLSDVIDLLPELREREVPTVVLSDIDEVLAEADHPVDLPTGVREWLSPLTAIVPAQRLAIEVARRQEVPIDLDPGIDPAIDLPEV